MGWVAVLGLCGRGQGQTMALWVLCLVQTLGLMYQCVV